MSARTRTFLVVGVLAALAAVVVTAAAVLSAEEESGAAAAGPAPQPRQGFPPLELSLGIRDDAEAVELRRAAALYQQGNRKQAARVFARYDSLEAKLGSSFAAWPASEDRIEQLGALYPRSSLVQLHVGLARFWAGTAGALTAWREARDVEPDTPYAVRADDLLHPEFAPGLPGFIVGFDYEIEGETPADAAGAARGRQDAARAAALRDRAPGTGPARLGAARVRARRASWRRTTSTRSSPTLSGATTRAIPRRRSPVSARSAAGFRMRRRSASTSACCCSGRRT